MHPKISIIIPCLNEEEAIGPCLEEISGAINKHNLDAEVIVVDNNSSDKTTEIAESKKCLLAQLLIVKEVQEGYGLAYLQGFRQAKGEYIFMADADSSYDFYEINKFLDKLEGGDDLVIGNRFSGSMKKGAMTWLHRYIGNPILSRLVKLLFNIKINDIHCGARAFRTDILNKVNFKTGGMEFASEMIIKAKKADLKISEVPIAYRPRLGKSKLNSLTDGWRHLRFILLYSPLLLFLVPGLSLISIGFGAMIFFYFKNPEIFGIKLYVHPLFLFSLMIILGYQLIIFSAFSKIYAINHLGDKDKLIESWFKKITIEKAGSLAIVMILIGVLIYLIIFANWINSGFSSLNAIKSSIVALTLIVLGVQTFFSAFMLSILGIKEK
ncbi:glycosyltransferase [Candidatus Falkowbacteria bacterium]|nr:glycosyltransferase [Candidatus Falkowbacteria bacterium]